MTRRTSDGWATARAIKVAPAIEEPIRSAVPTLGALAIVKMLRRFRQFANIAAGMRFRGGACRASPEPCHSLRDTAAAAGGRAVAGEGSDRLCARRSAPATAASARWLSRASASIEMSGPARRGAARGRTGPGRPRRGKSAGAAAAPARRAAVCCGWLIIGGGALGYFALTLPDTSQLAVAERRPSVTILAEDGSTHRHASAICSGSR